MGRLKIEKASGHTLRLILSSGDEEYPGCKLHVAAAGYSLTVSLPPILRPYRRVVFAGWDTATVLRMGRNWYWDYTERQYGFYLFENHFNILYGRQSHDSSTEQRWGLFLPWSEWRHVRHSIYDKSGALFWSSDKRRGSLGNIEDCIEARKDPSVVACFTFRDFDGEQIKASTCIEEREWHKGEGWFKWLSWFTKPRIHRSLNIEFSAETGPRKGSWKGGTLGHGIEMLAGEMHEAAFRRYCVKHNMTYLIQTPFVPTPASAPEPGTKQSR